MPLYRYKAVNTSGDVAAGELDAANESEIVDRLRDQGLMPMQVVAAAGERVAAAQKAARHRWFAPRRVTRDHLLAFTRELATLLRAGLPLDRALEILIGLATAPPVARLLQAVRDSVRGGKSLSQALDMHREVFSRFYVNIVRAGEAGGALGAVLTRLSETMERNKELRESVKSALIYPIILICVAVTSVMILLVFVVPQFQQTFAQAGKALPVPTQVVIFVGTGLRKYWWLLIAVVVAGVWLFRRWLSRPAARFRWDQRLLRWPLIGDLTAKVEVARFARRQGLWSSAARDGAVSAARDPDDPRRRGVGTAGGDAQPRGRRLRSRGGNGGQAFSGGARAGIDSRAGGADRRHRVFDPARGHGHERTCGVKGRLTGPVRFGETRGNA